MNAFQYNILPFKTNSDLLRVLTEAGVSGWKFSTIIEPPTQFQPGTILVVREFTPQGGI